MASGNSFAALERRSKTGSSPTTGLNDSNANASVPSMSIGAVEDYRDAYVATDARAAFRREPIHRNPFAQISRTSIAEEKPEAKVYDIEVSKSPFAHLERNSDGSGTGIERVAKKDIQAVKVVTRLIQGISFNPGSKAANAVKSQALRDQLVQVTRMAQLLAAKIDINNLPRPWLVAQCAEAIADMVAKRSEFLSLKDVDSAGDEIPISNQLQAVMAVFDKSGIDAELADVITDLSENIYEPATSESVIHDRLHISTSAAIWDIHQKIIDSGFSFGLEPIEVAKMLSKGILATTVTTNIHISSTDLQTAHLQGSIRRLASLISHEYHGRADTIKKWIDEGKESGDNNRMQRANESFVSEILPEIISTAKKNFISIEKIAPMLIERATDESTEESSLLHSTAPNDK